MYNKRPFHTSPDAPHPDGFPWMGLNYNTKPSKVALAHVHHAVSNVETRMEECVPIACVVTITTTELRLACEMIAHSHTCILCTVFATFTRPPPQRVSPPPPKPSPRGRPVGVPRRSTSSKSSSGHRLWTLPPAASPPATAINVFYACAQAPPRSLYLRIS